MKDGEIVTELDHTEASEETILAHATAVRPPQPPNPGGSPAGRSAANSSFPPELGERGLGG
jgi:hypothetical protein